MSTAHTSASNNNGNGSSDEDYQMPRTPKRTPVACTFCRGRKLKCDGRQTCSNCNRRGLACTYLPVSAQKQ
ncbi:uncharacterized protein LAESUDRAFT_727586 [Laetiporus sulphureus 93-53]|uniref:Zn(2)-C6 fungal-type domain-containing protein n=1 Tax=Laetiporus sulphureus 93-53 TaxID=1314785 RepID=A0A165DJC6_9APHY|nr:uncharacterized protein LAESUDRAFT_727586 [Laetiporus sulphureus 93-53]KZT05010.1 hypothetical protein LAESUDRAFT_727586 [Laetiporus sulphureus 93-53]